MSDEIDINCILDALNNEDNESIVKLDNGKIKDIKNTILQQLQIDRDSLKMLHLKLKKYRYIDEISDLHYGSYIRWISLKTPNNLYLRNGGIVCDMQVLEKGIHIVCKNNMNRLFQLSMEENLIFQKFSYQEELLLKIMDYLSKE
jgi:hypothetical protein